MLDYVLLIAGFVLLIVGGEMLVRGSVAIARELGMSQLLIGITLVGFGTSSPELVTSIHASFAGSPGIAVGNFVGSTISNIFLILGIAAILMPLTVQSHALQRDGGVMLAAIVAFAAVSYFHPLDRVVGACFVAGLIVYLVYAYIMESRMTANGHTAAYEKGEAVEEVLGEQFAPPEQLPTTMSASFGFLVAIIGLVTIIAGGKVLVDSAISIAEVWGVSQTVIGLTIVAVGTSMPELVTSCIAALRRHTDVAVGNILGSNIYNILGIGGLVGLIAPTEIPPEIVEFDNLVMISAAGLLLLFAYTQGRITRSEGALLLGCYVGYIYLLWPKPEAVQSASAAFL